MSKERLRQYILENYGTQNKFAKHIGWSRQRLSGFLASDASPKLEVVNMLARAMGEPVRKIIELLDE